MSAAGAAAAAPRLNAASCLECGGDFGRAGNHGSFCAARCRAAWNNRRLQRGAELYDLVMTLRFDRRRAGDLKVFTILSRAAALFRRQDLAERAGRRSWSDAGDVIARRPYLRARIFASSHRGRSA